MGLFLDFEKVRFSLVIDLQQVVNFKMGLFGNLAFVNPKAGGVKA
jgi:hypothetical protein